jgi:hypothetical protein
MCWKKNIAENASLYYRQASNVSDGQMDSVDTVAASAIGWSDVRREQANACQTVYIAVIFLQLHFV